MTWLRVNSDRSSATVSCQPFEACQSQAKNTLLCGRGVNLRFPNTSYLLRENR